MIAFSTWQPSPSECPICYETYTDPRILPSCGHSVCGNCVEGITAARASQRLVVCPECRAESEVTGEGLPKNHRFAAVIAKQRDPFRWASAPPDPDQRPQRQPTEVRVQPVPVIPTVDSANALASGHSLHGLLVELGEDALCSLPVLTHTDRRRRIARKRPPQINPDECPACCKRFVDPRVLPGCGHSVCAGCVKELALVGTTRTSVACPECTKESRILSIGFPRNYRLTDIIAEHDAGSTRVRYPVLPLVDASAPTEVELESVETEDVQVFQSLPHAFATAPALADIESDDAEEIQDLQVDDEYEDVNDGLDIDHVIWNWGDALNALRQLCQPAEHVAITLLNSLFLLADYVAMTFLYSIFISLATTAIHVPLYAREMVPYFANNVMVPLLRFGKDVVVYFATHVLHPLLRIALALVVVVLSLPVLLALAVIVILLECLKPAVHAIAVLFRIAIAACRLVLFAVLMLCALALMNYIFGDFTWSWLLPVRLVACLTLFQTIYDVVFIGKSGATWRTKNRMYV